jgi:prepilin-type N-terminal cleavage/methylation domain-containing protein
MDSLKFRQNGFSLVELMLAMSLSLFMIAGLFVSVIGDLKSYESVRATEQLVNKSQMSLKSLRLYLVQAGFRDLDNLMADTELAELVTSSTTGLNWSADQSLQGLNAIVAGDFSGAKATSDVIALRFIGITSGSTSTNSNVINCTGDAVIDDDYEMALYVSDTDDLVCLDENGETILDTNIEHMHIKYALEDGYKYYDADDAAIGDWSSVDRVKIAVLLSQDVTANFVTNGNNYTLFDRTISAANDTNFRLVTTETILIRN